ncbi:MAG: DUF58 domain-containing protein [Dehalococcoidia bacterium]
MLALVLFIGLVLAQPAVLLVALPIAIHLTVGLALARHPKSLQVTRSLSAHRTHEGDIVEAELSLQNTDGHLDLVMLIEEQELARHRSEGTTSLATPLPDGGSMLLSYATRPPRGFYPLAGPRTYVRDLLGFTTWESTMACPTRLWVFPRYDPVGRVGLSPRQTLSIPGSARSRRGGEGVQFLATRPYIPGDNLRRINWKALARCNQPVINLYEEERAANVTVVLDGRDRIYLPLGGQEPFEHAVRACAALCDSAIRDGHRTGLLLYGERLEWVFSGCGRVQRERLLQELARANLGFSDAFSDLGNLPSRLFPSGSSVIIVSPFAPGDEEALGLLRARGYDVLALVPVVSSPENTRQESIRLAGRLIALERELMLQVLMSAGIRIAVWDVSHPLGPVINAAWRRRQ